MQSKENILRKVNQKIRYKELKIIFTSVFCCIFVSLFVYYFVFVKQIPLESSLFYDVKIESHLQTINQINEDEHLYNELLFITKENLSGHSTMNFYIEKNEDNTSNLYFYFSQSLMQKWEMKKSKEELRTVMEKYGMEYKEEDIKNLVLLSPTLCKTDLNTALSIITKVYYLKYDYNHYEQNSFEQAKDKALLLWELL